MRIDICELSRHGTKSASDHLQVFYHFLITSKDYFNYNRSSTRLISQYIITIEVRK